MDRRVRIGSLLLTFFVVLVASSFALAQSVTLTIWDGYTPSDAGRYMAMQEAIKEFQAAHPDVKIQETNRSFDADKAAIFAALNAGSGPDILTVNNGEQMMGPLVRAGRVVNLDPYAQKYGWERNLFSPGLWRLNRYSEDGTELGTGHIYGVSLDGELVGVYYNKDLFNKLGLKVPRTFAEFEQVAKKLKDAGVIPIAFGAKDTWPFFHLYGEILGSTLTHELGAAAATKWLQDAVLRWSPSVSWQDPAAVQAASILQDWVKKGYFFNGMTGLSIDDALALFEVGKAGMFIQGSWFSTNIVQDAKFSAGFFPFPSFAASEGLSPQVGGVATPVGINKASTHIDLAAEFLNTLLMSPKIRELQRQQSVLPPQIPVNLEGVAKGSLYYDILTTWNQVNEQDRMGQYLDWTTPTMGDTMGAAGQALLGLQITPEQFAQRVNADYQAWLKKKP